MSLKKKFPGHQEPFGFTHNADHVPDLPQYAHFQYSTYHEGDNFRVSLLLPASASMRQAMEERIAAGIAKSNADQAAADLAAKRAAEKEEHQPYSFDRARQSAHQKELAKATSELDAKEAEQALDRTLHPEKAENSLAVYEVHEPLKLLAGEKTPDKEIKERNRAIFDRLKALGRYRQVHSSDDIPQLLKSLAHLEQEQPHFREVIGFIRRCGELALRRKQRMHVPPILLAGGPGVGKTHFTLELARALRRPVERHSMDADHTASTLSGSARHWSNTNTGKVFDAVSMSERADHAYMAAVYDNIRKAHSLGVTLGQAGEPVKAPTPAEAMRGTHGLAHPSKTGTAELDAALKLAGEKGLLAKKFGQAMQAGESPKAPTPAEAMRGTHGLAHPSKEPSAEAQARAVLRLVRERGIVPTPAANPPKDRDRDR